MTTSLPTVDTEVVRPYDQGPLAGDSRSTRGRDEQI
jgi:hypothetical protein